jgi:hypothetical protein
MTRPQTVAFPEAARTDRRRRTAPAMTEAPVIRHGAPGDRGKLMVARE